jgi:hypothetical protein
MTGTGFAILAFSGKLAAKNSPDKYKAPLTDNPILARFFVTYNAAERTLQNLQRDGAYGQDFAGAEIIRVTITI